MDRPHEATVIEVHGDTPVNPGIGKSFIKHGQIVVLMDNGKKQVFFRGTGQIPHDVKVGDRGLVEWVDTPSAFYPVFQPDKGDRR